MPDTQDTEPDMAPEDVEDTQDTEPKARWKRYGDRTPVQVEWPRLEEAPYVYKQRHVVRVDVRNYPLTPGTHVYGFTLEDLCRLYDYSPAQLRAAMREGLDPHDLESLCMHWYDRMREETAASYDVEAGGRRFRFDLTFEPGEYCDDDDIL